MMLGDYVAKMSTLVQASQVRIPLIGRHLAARTKMLAVLG